MEQETVLAPLLRAAASASGVVSLGPLDQPVPLLGERIQLTALD